MEQQKTYTVNVTRVSANARTYQPCLSTGTLTPTLHQAQHLPLHQVSNATTSITVTARPEAKPMQRITVNGQRVSGNDLGVNKLN